MAFGYALYFTERPKHRVIRWDPDRNSADVVAGEPADGRADQTLNDPYGLAFDRNGSLVIADKTNQRLCRLEEGKLVPWSTKDVDGHRARLPESPANHDPDRPRSPCSLAVDPDGSILCAFFDDHTIYRILPDGELALVIGRVRNRPYFHDAPRELVPPSEARSEPIFCPTGLAARPDGTLFFVERHTRTVRCYHPARGLASVFPASQLPRWLRVGEAPVRGRLSDYHAPSTASLTIGPDGDLYVCDTIHSAILRVKPEQGTFERVVHIERPGGAPFDVGPIAVAFGPDGIAFVANSLTSSIETYRVSEPGPWVAASTTLTRVRREPLALGSGGTGLIVGP